MVKITETILRDAHQSLIATRLRIEDMIPALELLDSMGYHSLEVWGGATFDSCMRFLAEDPWERLRTIRKAVKKTKLQMLLRGQNLVGYRHYADDVVDRFVELAAKNGIDIFRIFDALNDVRNMEQAIRAAVKTGKHVQGTISYTLSPVHTEDLFVTFAKELKGLGCHSICIKDMAGLLDPAACTSLVSRLKKEVALPVQVHTHCTSGLAQMTYFAAAEAGADVVDCALSPFSGGTSQPPTESVVFGFAKTPYDTGMDPTAFKPLTAVFKEVRKKYDSMVSPISERVDVDVLIYQIPGGMLSNLVSQLEKQKKLDRYEDVLLEVPRVRTDMGYPPLVTPTSQIVGTQAVMNVIAGERYKMITKETKEYVRGMYGRTPAPISPEIRKLITGDEPMVDGRPGDHLKPELPEIKEKYKDLIKKEEDVISLALYPEVAAKLLSGKAEAEPMPSVAAPAAAAAAPAAAPAAAAPAMTGPGRYQVQVNGKVFTVDVAPVTGGAVLPMPAAPAAPAPVAAAPSAGARALPSPLQGTVFKILVKVGDRVETNSPVLILEAMKMENEITAPFSGVVSQILVKEGQGVDADAPLMVLE
ncbi:sodium-extruding oxaloacetate decarboxylase subunit alpha [Myxococcota bacterium]|nr:sodium-extruding oxaloacetate decarboxylase subunit alpha [Myxococcota bacterium]